MHTDHHCHGASHQTAWQNTGQNHAGTHPFRPHQSKQCLNHHDIPEPTPPVPLSGNCVTAHPAPEMPVKIHVPSFQSG